MDCGGKNIILMAFACNIKTYVCSNSFQENCLPSKSCFSFPLFPKKTAKSVAKIQYFICPRIDLYSDDENLEKIL